MGTTKKTFDKPDDSRTFGKGNIALLKMDNLVVGKAVFEPGWRWSEHVKPIVNTASCMTHHNGYVLSGRMHIKMDDGTEVDVGPGDAFICPPGHDAWTVGDEPCVALDFAGAATYAKPA